MTRSDIDASVPSDLERGAGNVLRITLDGHVEWGEKQDGFPMRFDVPLEIRNAGISTDELWARFHRDDDDL